jgi:hypothetical protein
MTDQEPNDAATAMVDDVVATNVDVGNPGQGTRSTFPQQIVRGGFTLLGKALQEQEVLDRVEDVVHMLEDAQTPLHNNIGTEGKELLKAYASGNAFGQTVQRRVQDELMAAAPDAAPGGNSVANRICAARSFLKCVNDAEQEVVDCLRSVQAWRDALDNATSNRTDAEKELLNAQSHLTECDTNLAKARAVADGTRLNAETHAFPDPEGETDAGVRTGRRLDKEVRDAERIVAEKQTAQEDAAELCARAQERLAAAQGAVNYTLLQMQEDEAQLAVLVQDRDGLRANYNKTATSIAGLIQKQSPTDALVSSITIDCMRLQQQRAAAEAADAEAGKQQATAEANRARARTTLCPSLCGHSRDQGTCLAGPRTSLHGCSRPTWPLVLVALLSSTYVRETNKGWKLRWRAHPTRIYYGRLWIFSKIFQVRTWCLTILSMPTAALCRGW